MTDININGAAFVIVQNGSKCIVQDTRGNVIGYTRELPDAVELCEQLARTKEDYA